MGEEFIEACTDEQVKAASSNNGYEAESKSLWYNISLQKQVARAENNVYTYKSWRNVNFPIDHIGVGCMDELFPTRYMVSPWSRREKDIN